MSYKKKSKRTQTFADIKKEVIHGPEVKILRKFEPKTSNQELYFDSIEDFPITFCYGVAGTGKTSVAAYKACKMLSEGHINNIILTRPMVQTGEGLGFLPGKELDKVLPYMIPLIDEIESMIGPSISRQLMNLNKIRVCPLETMRGRNFHNSFMILDEAQNCTVAQIKLFLSRLGHNSKCVICGDTRQTDLGGNSGFIHCMNLLSGSKYVNFCEMSYEDIQRSPVLKDVLGRLEL